MVLLVLKGHQKRQISLMIEFDDIEENTIVYCNMTDSDDFYFIEEKKSDKFIATHLLILTLKDPELANVKKAEINGSLWNQSFKSNKARLVNKKDKRNVVRAVLEVGKDGF